MSVELQTVVRSFSFALTAIEGSASSFLRQVQERRAQWRAASRRHQRSPEGRLDHRDRQRSYRVAVGYSTACRFNVTQSERRFVMRRLFIRKASTVARPQAVKPMSCTLSALHLKCVRHCWRRG